MTTSGAPRSPFIGLLVLPILAVPLYFGLTGIGTAWRLRKTLALSSADEGGRTKAHVVTGTAVDGNDAGRAAWLGHVGAWTRSGKSSTFSTLCVVSRVDGLKVRDASGATFTVRGVDGHTGDFSYGLTMDPARVAVGFERSDALPRRVPSSFPENLAKPCAPYVIPTGHYDYDTRFIERGDPVTVRGCLSSTEPNVIEPCGDGLDVVSSFRLATVRSTTRDQQAGALLGGVVASFVLLGLVGLFGSSAIIRSTRKKDAA